MNYTRILVYKHIVNFVEDTLSIHDPKYENTIEIPFDNSCTAEQNIYNWLDSKNIPYIGAMSDHVICEFDGPLPVPSMFDVPTSHVFEISPVKNDTKPGYQMKIYTARYNQSVYIDLKDGVDTIDNAYEYLIAKGYTLISSDVDSLKMYVVSDVMKPLYTTVELV